MQPAGYRAGAAGRWPVPAVSPASEMAAPAGQDLAGDPRRWLIMGVVLAGTFIAIVDVSVVNPGGRRTSGTPCPRRPRHRWPWPGNSSTASRRARAETRAAVQRRDRVPAV